MVLPELAVVGSPVVSGSPTVVVGCSVADVTGSVVDRVVGFEVETGVVVGGGSPVVRGDDTERGGTVDDEDAAGTLVDRNGEKVPMWSERWPPTTTPAHATVVPEAITAAAVTSAILRDCFDAVRRCAAMRG